MMEGMGGMMQGMGWGMGLVGAVVVLLAILGLAALIKYLFFQ